MSPLRETANFFYPISIFLAYKNYDYFFYASYVWFNSLFNSSASVFYISPAKQKESRYYLFMFHGWLSINNIESQNEQGKIGETIAQSPLFMRFAINSHCIKSVVFTISHCPTALKLQFQWAEMRKPLL